MTTQIGIVTEIDSGGQATVLANRKGACGGCQTHGSGCSSCLAGAKFESQATNAIGARPGDLVRISLDSKIFLKGAAMLYLIPVAALLIGALSGTWIAAQIGLAASIGGIFGAVAAVCVAAFILIRFDRSPSFRQDLQPKIIEILSMNGHPSYR